MKRIILFVIVFSLFLINPVYARSFRNCTDLHRVYPNGVAKSAVAAGATRAIVNLKVYNENKKSDRDKDGIACETS
jgi:hypothetical protein